MTSAATLFEQAMELSPTDRQDLTVRLVDALPVEKESGDDEARGKELDRRWAEHKANPGIGHSLGRGDEQDLWGHRTPLNAVADVLSFSGTPTATWYDAAYGQRS